MKRKAQLTLIWIAALSFPAMMIICEVIKQ